MKNVVLPVGSHQITASYSDGSGGYAPSSTTPQASSLITTIAGGSVGDGDPATSASLQNPAGLAADAAGDLYIAYLSHSGIREANHATGIITTVAGNGVYGYGGDGGPATSAELCEKA